MSLVYVSTGAFKTKNIVEILDIAYKNNIRSIELSAGLNYNPDTIAIVKQAGRDFNFLVHNYFPTPVESFCLNLASVNQATITRSINMCKDAIDLVSYLGAEFYSVHCGFTFESNGKELGSDKQLALKRIPIEAAEIQFIKNVQLICDYADEKNIKIALENNVLAQYASLEKDIYLGVSHINLSKIIKDVNRKNLFVLLDLAHAHVSNTFLQFDMNNMIKELEQKIIAVHISDNDGFYDQNKKILKNSVMLKFLSMLKDRKVVLEVYNLEPQEIHEQIKLLEEILNYGR